MRRRYEDNHEGAGLQNKDDDALCFVDNYIALDACKTKDTETISKIRL